MTYLETSHQGPRKKMVDRDLRGRGIADTRILTAFETVPRHLFVPEHFVYRAYDDHPLPIGDGQTISQPFIVASMIQSLKVGETSRVLDIGTGSGYQAAILSLLCKQVYTMDCISLFVSRSKRLFDRLGYHNISARLGDGRYGWPDFGPYDAIAVAAWAAEPPIPLIAQLKEGGRLVIPIGNDKAQKLMLYTKEKGVLIAANLGGCSFVPLVHKEP